MIRVGFVNPSSDYLMDPFKGDPHTHFHILSILDDTFQDKIETCLIDLRGVKREFAIHHIPECDIYLHSVYTLDYEEQKEIVKNLKISYPNSTHIAGGPHVATFMEESLRVFDSLIIGEGEKTIVQAINDHKNNELKPIYRRGEIIDINEYPHDKRHYIPTTSTARKNMMNLRRKPDYGELLGTTVMFSRGCPYNCHFCALAFSRKESPGIRFRSTNHVKEEISYLKQEYGIQGINLHDEICFPLNQKRAITHLEAIGESDIIWRGQCRIDGINSEIAKLAHESGCIALGLGLESVIQSSLNLINKQIQIERAKETIRILKENEIEVRLYMIIGLPGEPPDIVEKTWNFIKDMGPDMVSLSLFTVRPGTEVYNNPEKFGIKLVDMDWSKTMHMYGRYSDETPHLNFEYQSETPWGTSLPSEQIIKNYLELQKRLKDSQLGTATPYKN